jgi:hypothetical protein
VDIDAVSVNDFISAKTFRAYGTNFLRQKKKLRDKARLAASADAIPGPRNPQNLKRILRKPPPSRVGQRW